MEQQTAQRVADLLKRKSKLISDLATLTEPENSITLICSHKNVFVGGTTLTSLRADFKQKVRKLAMTHIEEAIKEINQEIHELK